MGVAVLKYWKFACVTAGFLAICVFAYQLTLKDLHLQTLTSRATRFRRGSSEINSSEGTRFHDRPSKMQPQLNYLRENSIPDTLGGIDIDKDLNLTQVALTLHSYLDNQDAICRRKIRMGHMDDGGWEICDDQGVRPEPPCIIYSFGIATDWTFDDDASRVYGCHVFAFDPSIGLAQHDRSQLVHFYPWGLAGLTGTGKNGWPMFTFGDIKRKLGHTDKVIDIVKMDIERSEWAALPEMLASKQLDMVRQLYAEYHVTSAINNRAALKTIQAIEKIGFKRFYVRKNFHCSRKERGFPVMRTSCYEVMYMRS